MAIALVVGGVACIGVSGWWLASSSSVYTDGRYASEMSSKPSKYSKPNELYVVGLAKEVSDLSYMVFELQRHQDRLIHQIQDLHTNLHALQRKVAQQELVPVGGIIDWWHPADMPLKYPAEYEVCDGSDVRHKDSPIYSETKPDLTGRYTQGAAAGTGVVGRMAGGNMTKLPAHEHGLEAMYFERYGGTCGGGVITSVHECQQAAQALGIAGLSGVKDWGPGRPRGCFRHGPADSSDNAYAHVYYNMNTESEMPCQGGPAFNYPGRGCVCRGVAGPSTRPGGDIAVSLEPPHMKVTKLMRVVP